MSRRHGVALMVASMLLCGSYAFGVEPAYNGPMGNPEEPALRPVKWFWHGAKALVHHTFHGFNKGREQGFCPAVRGTARGAERGVVRLSESVYKGAIGVRVPAKGSFRQIGHWNEVLEAEFKLHREDDATANVDPADASIHPPVEAGESPSGGELEREPVQPAARPTESRVEHARRAYLGERARVNEPRPGRGNLLRLAR
ncbi:MAG: hypothetical protein KA184_02250 [Candidatus Hydrogenedentes bacterium]|nr:hypothetical protein [Candidatus Hydrogenedentota bacterium]